MDVVLRKVASAKDDMVVITLVAHKDSITVDLFDYIDRLMDLRVTDEVPAKDNQ